MAETPSKRQRDESELELDVDETKRHKSYNHILSILDEEEDEPTQDLSSLITTLQQELSSSSSSPATAVPDLENSVTNAATVSVEEEEDDKERVIRHLLEASDDELGIPNINRSQVEEYGYEEFVSSENGLDASDGFSLCDGLWEFEDANANYYTLLQSELFM